MILTSKVAYHGSGSNFDTFDLTFMSSGEGHQVHGWGIYLTESKDTAQGYRDKLEGRGGSFIFNFDDGTTVEVTPEEITNGDIGKIKSKLHELGWIDTYNDKMISMLYKYRDIEDYKYFMNRMLWRAYDNPEFIEACKHNLEIINHVTIGHEHTGMLATVEIPDDWNFAEEHETIDKQPQRVKEIIYSNFDPKVDMTKYELPPSAKGSIRTIITKYIHDRRASYQYDTIFEMFNDWFENYDDEAAFDTVSDKLDLIFSANCAIDLDEETLTNLTNSILKYVNNYKVTRKYDTTFENFYDNLGEPEEVSEQLYALGIHGIHYDGMTDGSCFVVFNPKGLIIKEKE